MAERLVACVGKVRHAGKAQALLAMDSLRRGGRMARRSMRSRVVAYRCPHCAGWHVGSKPGVRRA